MLALFHSLNVSFILTQINLHTNLEDKLPYWLMKRVDKRSITVYPNKKCAKFRVSNIIMYIIYVIHISTKPTVV